ncbi:MAG: hypothetical protein D6702_13210 [Planctomycetota bacterium]|nr:MAG: hypothetical protein D6702_13210 [Planctomycetota bacterium]
MSTARNLSLPLLLLGGLLAGCGDSGPEFTDPLRALRDANAALVAGDSATCQAGYEYAIEHGEGETHFKALLGLGKFFAPQDADRAAELFRRLADEHPDLYDAHTAQKVIQAWIDAGRTDLALEALKAAADRFPDDKDLFSPQAEAIQAKEAGAAADLSDLGYVGD